MNARNEQLSRLYRGRSEETTPSSVKPGMLLIATRRFGLEAYAARVERVDGPRPIRVQGRRVRRGFEIWYDSGVSGMPHFKAVAESGKVLVAS